MENNKTTFTLTVSGTDDQELQGLLQTSEGKTLLFRSSIELLTQLNAQMTAKAGCESTRELTT